MATEPSVREIRLWLQRIYREIDVVDRTLERLAAETQDAYREEFQRQAPARARVAELRAREQEPRSPFTHASSTPMTYADPSGPMKRRWNHAWGARYWLLYDVKRRVASAERALKHFDTEDPPLEPIARKRRKRR